MNTTVYQITKIDQGPNERPIVIAMTSKKSAQRITAELAEQGELARAQYKLTRFSHPELPLIESGWSVKFLLTTFVANFEQIAGSGERSAVHEGSQEAAIFEKIRSYRLC